MRKPNHTIYRSKIDSWVHILVWWLLALFSVPGAVICMLNISLTEKLVIIGMHGAIFAFVLWIMTGTNYRFTADALLIRSGPFRWTIRLQDIESITPTDEISSSPALSLDRLHIRYAGGDDMMISPVQKKEFLQELRERAPRVSIGAEGL